LSFTSYAWQVSLALSALPLASFEHSFIASVSESVYTLTSLCSFSFAATVASLRALAKHSHACFVASISFTASVTSPRALMNVHLLSFVARVSLVQRVST